MIRLRRTYYCVMLCLFAAALTGCEEDVAAPDGLGKPFSVYGILNPRLPTQTLLVSPIEARLTPIGSFIDAVVTSTDLTTGARYLWSDSVVANQTGRLDHVFWAQFRPDFGSRHRIEVVRSDGARSSVDVHVPPQVTIENRDDGTQRLTVEVLGENFRMIRADAVFYVRFYAEGTEWCDEFPTGTYSFSLQDAAKHTSRGYALDIDLDVYHERLRSRYYNEFHESHGIRYRNPFVTGLALLQLKLSITVGDEAWNPAAGEFDRDVLVQPGTLSNVTNGLGFVGGGYNQDRSLYPSRRAIDDTWFFDFLMREPGCNNYCSCGRE